MLGWVFDVAAAHKTLAAGEEIDRTSSLASVPGFGGATDLSALRGRYRVMRAPFDAGAGYYGIELAALDENGKADGLYLLNRLFRMPILLQEPIGFATDIVTNGAMLFGGGTEAIADLKRAADTAFIDAAAIGLQVYIHPDGSGGAMAGDQSFFAAVAHAGEHLLNRFDHVSLSAALRDSLASMPSRCDGLASPS